MTLGGGAFKRATPGYYRRMYIGVGPLLLIIIILIIVLSGEQGGAPPGARRTGRAPG